VRGAGRDGRSHRDICELSPMGRVVRAPHNTRQRTARRAAELPDECSGDFARRVTGSVRQPEV
jgi:hypothetical protein